MSTATSKSFVAFAQEGDILEVQRHQQTMLKMAIDQYETSGESRKIEAAEEAVSTLNAAIKKAPNSSVVPTLLLYKGIFLLTGWRATMQREHEEEEGEDQLSGSERNEERSTLEQSPVSRSVLREEAAVSSDPASPVRPPVVGASSPVGSPGAATANSATTGGANANSLCSSATLIEDAMATADQSVILYPGRCEGYYLRCMVFSEQEKIQDAVRNFKVAQRIRDDLEQEFPPVKAAMDQLAMKIKKLRSQKMKDAFKNHARTYNAYSNLKCLTCGATFDTPTPRWLCTKCYTGKGKESLIWEPDEERNACSQCNTSSFGFGGRHHCRCCGKLVCGKCSKEKMEIPLLHFEGPVRVCNSCSATHTLNSVTKGMATGKLPKHADDPYKSDALVMEDA